MVLRVYSPVGQLALSSQAGRSSSSPFACPWLQPHHRRSSDPWDGSLLVSPVSNLSVCRTSGMKSGINATVARLRQLDAKDATHKRSNCADSSGAPDGRTPRHWSSSAPQVAEIVPPRL